MRKSLALFVTFGLIATSLSGCGSNSNTNTASKSASTASSTAKTSSASKTKSKTSTAGSNGEEVVLKVFDAHAYGLDEYAKMVKAFEASHPGVKIDVQHSSNDYTATLQSRINSGDAPDVFDAQAGTNARNYYDYAYDWTNDTDITSKFRPDALALGTVDGKVMSLPWTYENMGLLYNVDAFEKAGIKTLPTNMDELEDACKKLKAAGITPFGLAAKESWVLSQAATHFMMDKSLDSVGTVEAVKSGKLKFADMPHWKNLFRFLDLAKKYGPDKPLEIDWETSENLIANGKVAIIHMGDWCQATLDKFNKDARIAFLPVPVGSSEKDATLLSTCNWTYIVNKDSKHLDLAKEYLEYILTSDEGQTWMCDGIGAVPGVKTDKEIKGKLANDAARYIAEKKTNGWIHTIAPSNYYDNVGPVLQSYMLGETTADDATETIQEFWTSGN